MRPAPVKTGVGNRLRSKNRFELCAWHGFQNPPAFAVGSVKARNGVSGGDIFARSLAPEPAWIRTRIALTDAAYLDGPELGGKVWRGQVWVNSFEELFN